jgi:putative resolvase
MNGIDKNFVAIKEAVKISGIGAQTLRKLCDDKKIQCYKTLSGQRKINKACLERLCNPVVGGEVPRASEKQNFIYTRVSSKKQLDDLSRQIEYIHRKKPESALYTSLSDVASGINFKRKGLQTLLDSCLRGTIGELVIAHRDRLCRFGYELIEQIVEKSGGRITVLDVEDKKHTSSEQELAEDLLSIVHIYSCRQMGKRKYKGGNAECSKSETETDQETTNDN